MELYFMVLRVSQIYAFMSSIHTNKKLKSMVLTIITSTTFSNTLFFNQL